MEAPGRAGRALGNHPKAIHGDGAAEFEHSDCFKTWHRKHKIAFNPVEPYLHTMQGYIENLVKQMKVHSRCILKHANLPSRFWSETTTMYMAVRNIMPTDKMKVQFTVALSHWLHFDPKLMLHRLGCLVVVKYPKDHLCVTDTSNGASAAFSLDDTQPRLWLKSGSPALLLNSAPFFEISPCNHFINKQIIFFFFRRSKRQRIFPLFYFAS
jgi:hypothetical protein